MPKKIPLRKCLGCQEMKDKRTLIRIVKNKDDDFFVDKTGKMNGRGAYICPDTECFNKMAKNRSLEKSFQCKVPPEIIEQLQKELNHID